MAEFVGGNSESGVIEIKSLQQYEQNSPNTEVLVIFFWATWHTPSAPGGQMDQVFTQLQKMNKDCRLLRFLKVEAEAVPEVSVKFNVVAVPLVVVTQGGAEVGRVEGANPGAVADLVKSAAARAATSATSTSAGAGPGATPAATAQTAPGQETEQELSARLEKLINAGPVMLFMKGTGDNPRCKFSRQMVQILKDANVSFASFDIFSDEAVRQGLKKFSNWPTYPQLYVAGQLIGGVDIVQEMAGEGNLQDQLGVPAEPAPAPAPATVPLEERLKALVNKQRVMLFIKGDPDQPRCGFSNTLVGLLRSRGAEFGHFDILSDPEVRQGLKDFSNWPTYPQLYIDGDLIGGLDICQEMDQGGELEPMLKG